MLMTNMTEQAIRQICSWEYDYPYSVYNYMPYDEAMKSGARITQPEHQNDFLCFWDGNKLIAYINLLLRADKLFLGIGLAPDYCSKGMGKSFLLQGVEQAYKKYGNDIELWLQVRKWNERAIKCYLSCGFELKYSKTITDRFGKDEEFCFMRLENY